MDVELQPFSASFSDSGELRHFLQICFRHALDQACGISNELIDLTATTTIPKIRSPRLT